MNDERFDFFAFRPFRLCFDDFRFDEAPFAGFKEFDPGETVVLFDGADSIEFDTSAVEFVGISVKITVSLDDFGTAVSTVSSVSSSFDLGVSDFSNFSDSFDSPVSTVSTSWFSGFSDPFDSSITLV